MAQLVARCTAQGIPSPPPSPPPDKDGDGEQPLFGASRLDGVFICVLLFCIAAVANEPAFFNAAAFAAAAGTRCKLVISVDVTTGLWA